VNYEQGLTQIVELGEWARLNDELLSRNEAQTRLDLIDRLLASLGWSRPDIRVELRVPRLRDRICVS
jgi:hypothetical protein